MKVLTLAALAVALTASTSMAQEPKAMAKKPWDEAFLPPAPHWQGASQALIRDKTDPWVTPFEADAEHNFSPTYADTRAWFDHLDKASKLIRVEDFGVSPQGRAIFAVIASKDGEKLDPKKPIDGEALVAAGVVRRVKDGVRLLGSGELKTKVELSVHSASASARKAIEAAGGKLTTVVAPAEASAEG